MRATIVTLEPSVEIESVTFEQAFGESSDFKGRGRAKRQKRRQERRMKRISDRSERKKAKQSMRAEQQEARQTRKDVRKARKNARKGEDEEESPEKEEPTDTEAATTDSSSSETETQPETETTDTEQADELGDNADVADEESSFDAETTGDNSSFDDENYDTETSEAAGRKSGGLGLGMKKIMHAIAQAQDRIKRHKTALQSGKLPSNKVAQHAKMLKYFSAKLQQLNIRLAQMKQMAAKRKLTPVKSALEPKFSKNKIVVPAKGADGEDSSMFDDFNNADGDDTSSFDGKAFVSKNKGFLIGLGIGIVAVLVLNKMKVFK
jgi:hypothetical protein